MPLYREDLDDPPRPTSPPEGGAHPPGGSGGPPPPRNVGDDDLWFHAKCHLDSPTWARYRDGILTIQCARCERDVVALHVAPRPPRGGPGAGSRLPG